MTDSILPFTVTSWNQEKNQSPSISVLISFYNHVPFLRAVLESLSHQSFQNFELIICDDGSQLQNVQKIQQDLSAQKFPCTYVWQKDQGFRKNECLNKGILQSRADYLVFVDQDCILHPDFLLDHWTERQESCLLAGRRTDLTPWVSGLVLKQQSPSLFLQKNFFWIFFLILWMKDNNAPKGIRIPWKFLNRLLNRKNRGVVGCNFSVAKKDIFAVNGFDMRYHWAGTGEDSDIEYRLKLHGVRSLPLCHKAIQYHLWHRLQHRHTEPEVLFAEVKKLQQKVTPAGLQILKAMNEL